MKRTKDMLGAGIISACVLVLYWFLSAQFESIEHAMGVSESEHRLEHCSREHEAGTDIYFTCLTGNNF